MGRQINCLPLHSEAAPYPMRYSCLRLLSIQRSSTPGQPLGQANIREEFVNRVLARSIPQALSFLTRASEKLRHRSLWDLDLEPTTTGLDVSRRMPRGATEARACQNG